MDPKNRTTNPQILADWDAYVQQMSNTQTQTQEIPLLFLGGDDDERDCVHHPGWLTRAPHRCSALTAWNAFVQKASLPDRQVSNK